MADLPNNYTNSGLALIQSWLSIASELSWIKTIGQIWVMGRKLLHGLSSEGMYEVLDYETVLEIKDKQGKNAVLKKHEKVRYLQNNIIAFQDQAWGDGKSLVNYRCKPGLPVDRYRCGYKTYILISLRKVKCKGNVDNFNIEWSIKQGFIDRTGFWATEISHNMKNITVKVIFPKNRPPQNVFIVERNRQRTLPLGEAARVQLPDGRWLLSWEKHQPRLYEQYILNWEW